MPSAPMILPTQTSVLAELAVHPQRELWSHAARQSALDAFSRRDTKLSATLSEGAQTPYGDLQELLNREPQTDTERWLLNALLALSLLGDSNRAETLVAFTWLSTHTQLNPLGLLNDALAAEADLAWPRLAHIARSPRDFGLGRGEALVAAASLSAGTSPAAIREAQELSAQSTDALLLAILSPTVKKSAATGALRGELATAPRHPFWTVVLGLSGVLALVWLVKLIARYVLAMKRPAELRLSHRGLEYEHRTELLGRVLKDREALVPLGNIARVTREVRYSRASLYAGLIALALGLYISTSLFVDGLRVPGLSPSLLLLGSVAAVLGLGVDFALSSLTDSARGKCRIVIEQRKGKKLCVGALDPASADAMLSRLAEETKA